MSWPWLLAALHLLGLAMSLGSVWARARCLKGRLDADGLRAVFYADNWWGISALMMIGTGLLRAFAGFDKGASYYMQNHLFLTKMGLLILILALEIPPMVTLISWRIRTRRGESIDTSKARTFARISHAQAGLLILMVLAATGMARGYGTRP